MIVSLAGQAMRLYEDGKLVRAFLVTSGRAERPSLPGLWSIQERLITHYFQVRRSSQLTLLVSRHTDSLCHALS